ncbi:hypothetical protein [Kitasatospora sp. NPDC059571]|uniref:hypothetical protein n=1 Tax=Kitasatospora sp. NPDC059571 TaxID=3346871 RepID=UPI0036A69139
MTRIVVMLEIEEPRSTHELGGGEHPEHGRAALVVHAVPVDRGAPAPAGAPSAPGGAGPPVGRTFCGLDAADLQRDPYQPAEAGADWYPPRWAQRVCPTCAEGVRTL